MPIKFRCPHCRQFLGISRSKAGDVTDCPTCGRTIRVPNLDGHVAPVPKPQLNLKDAGLAEALGALASLNDLSDDIPVKPAQGSSVAETIESAIDQHPPHVSEAVNPAERFATPAQPVEPVKVDTINGRHPPQPGEPGPASPPFDHLEELARIAPKTSPVRPAPSSSKSGSGYLIAAILLCAGSFALGYVTSQILAPQPKLSSPAEPKVNVAVEKLPEPVIPPGNVTPEQPQSSGPLTSEDLGLRRFQGQVTYISQGGETRPDRGARILLLPAVRQGNLKLPADGFVSGLDETDRRIGEVSLAELGGAIVTADEQGKYSATCSGKDQVWVLVVSRYLTRTDGTALIGDAQKILDAYFDKPEKVVGKMRYDVKVFPPASEPASEVHKVEFPL